MTPIFHWPLLPPGQYVVIYLPGTSRTLNFCELTVKTKVNGLECGTNVDNTYYVQGNTYQLMCPACGTTGRFYSGIVLRFFLIWIFNTNHLSFF